MTGGIDKGPCLIYWRLSYRRKFIRSLWVFILSVAAWPLLLLLPIVWTPFGITYMVIMTEAVALTTAITLAYTYRKWQAELR